MMRMIPTSILIRTASQAKGWSDRLCHWKITNLGQSRLVYLMSFGSSEIPKVFKKVNMSMQQISIQVLQEPSIAGIRTNHDVLRQATKKIPGGEAAKENEAHTGRKKLKKDTYCASE
jgi:hypothetical protein